MKSSVFTTTVIVLLLLINIGTLTFIWTHKPHERRAERDLPNSRPDDRQPGPYRFLIHELDLNNDQQQKYMALVKEHRDAIKKIKESDREFHKLFFDLIKDKNPDIKKAYQFADSIANNKKKEEMITLNHFLKLKAICNTEQKEKFDEVIMEALRIMNPRPPKQ